jgi:hypothetical protein
MSSDSATGFGIKFLYSGTNTTFQILVAVLNYTNSELLITPKEINPMSQSWQRLSPTERWLLICQTVLIGAGALAEAMTNEASRQLDKYLEKII